MSVNVQEILDNLNDYQGNYSTGVLDTEVKLRAINRAIEFLKRKIGFPSDEKIQTFSFCEDQLYYNCAVDYDEGYQLLYHDERLNTPQYEWEYAQYPDILRKTGSSSRQLFSFAPINGRNQIMMLGSNLRKGFTIDSMEYSDDWAVTGSASGIETDTFQKYDGSGSIKFDIASSANGGIERDDFDLDLEDLFENHGRIKFWNYMTDDNIDDITLTLKTDDSNYYTILATTQDNGDAFAEDEWTKIGFVLDDAVAVGTPDSSNITEIKIDYDPGTGFTSAADFRVDLMFSIFPDEMDLLYYSRYKGTDITGVTSKVNLTLATDIVAFGEFFPDYLDLVARRAAMNCYPNLKGDKEFYQVYQSDLNDWIKTICRSHPRKRVIGSYTHKLRR